MRFVIVTVILFVSILSFSQDFSKDTTILRIEKIASEKVKTSAYNDAAEIAWMSGMFNEALEYSERGLKIAKQNDFKELESRLHNNRGVAYDFLSQYPSALKHYFAGLAIQEKLNTPDTKADLLGNIGLIYMSQGLQEKSLDYHTRALKIRESMQDTLGISASLNNVAIIYHNQGKHQEAIERYEKCIDIDTKLKDTVGLGDDYNNIALPYIDMGEYDIALDYLEKALEIRLYINDPRKIAVTYSNFGEVFFKQEDYDKAREYLKLAVDFGKSANERESLKFTYNLLQRNEEKAGDSASAYRYYKLYIQYRDSIDNSELARKQTSLELNYQFNKEKEVARLKQEQKDRQYKIGIIAVSAGLLLILFFSILFFRKWKQTQAQQRIIKEKNELVEQKNQEIMASISYAKRIQNAILPSSSELLDAFPNHFVLYLPKEKVSGDFYWMDESGPTQFLAVADCTGHGVPGAMMSVVCYNALNRSVHEFGKSSTADILDKTRELVINEISQNDESVTDGMDISLCAFEKGTNKIKWSGANNPLWIYRKASHRLEEVKADKQPIGHHRSPKPFNEHEVELFEGDRVYLFSDGYQDQFGGPKSKKMMRKGLKSVLLDSAKLSLKEQRALLNIHFMNWKNNLEQVDDVCIVGVECVK
jgi:serine phosphatase RsbU (regulator of sigma subunit)/tetratricopeptide (TPR) repeat protein